MHKLRLTLYVLAGVYLLLSVMGMLYDNQVMNQFSLLNLITYFKVWLSLGLILLIGIMLINGSVLQKQRKEIKRLTAEESRLKAHIFDLETAHREELARLQAEEEENERKMEAFRRSLPDTDKNKPDNPETNS